MVEQPGLKFQGEINGRRFESAHGNDNNISFRSKKTPRERRLFFIEIYKPLKYTIMKQNKREFLEAIGFEGNERDMVKQMLFGIGVGMAFIFMLGLAELFSDWVMK